MLSHSVVSDSVTPGTAAHRAPLSMGFSRPGRWRGLLCPPPGHPHNPATEPESLMSPGLAGGFFTTRATWETPSSPLVYFSNRRRKRDFYYIPVILFSSLVLDWQKKVASDFPKYIYVCHVSHGE